jgi:hypothetical protein
MSLDGLRAWIGEVERKLGARTRVFLVLVALAIGGAGAAIYLALDTRDQAVSEDEVQRLQEQIDGLEAGATGGADPRISQLELELDALKAQLESSEGKGATGSGGNGPGGVPAGGDSTSESSTEGGGSTPAGEAKRRSDETDEDIPTAGDKARGGAKSDPEGAIQEGASGGNEERIDDKDR